MSQIYLLDKRILCGHQTVIFDRYSADCRWIVVHWFEALKRPEETYFGAFFAANTYLLIYFWMLTMKKSLLALALMGAFSGAALAQSQVTVYGAADIGLQSFDNGGVAGSVTRLQSGLMKGSRLGFKGTETLTSDLKANFVLEMGLNLDDGSSAQGGRAFGRVSTVGLSGEFGSVDLGRDKTTIHKFIESFDPFETGYINNGGGLGNGTGTRTTGGLYFIGGTATVAGAANAANSTGRAGNAVFYSSPKVMGAFTAQAQYAFGEVAGDVTASSSMGLNLRYTANGLDIGYAYFIDKAQTAAPLSINEKSANTLAVTYDFGMVKPVLIYQAVKDQAALALKQNTFTVGATITINPVSRVLLTYSVINDKTAISATNKASVGEAKQFAVGYRYDFSKRTSIYSAFASTSQDANSQKLGAALAGKDVKEFTVGIRHFF